MLTSWVAASVAPVWEGHVVMVDKLRWSYGVTLVAVWLSIMAHIGCLRCAHDHVQHA